MISMMSSSIEDWRAFNPSISALIVCASRGTLVDDSRRSSV